MRFILTILVLSLGVSSVTSAQTRKKPRAKPPASRRPAPAPELAKVIGSSVVITTKNGESVSGSLVALSAYSIRIKSNGLESSFALETIESISFRPGQSSSSRQSPKQPTPRRHPDFGRDLDAVVGALQVMSALTKAGVEYSEYGNQLAELRKAVEKYITKYATSEDGSESRMAALVAGALNDYSWARTVWTLKLGYSQHPTVDEMDAPAVTDALALYPDLRSAAAASGTKYVADKLIAGLWRQASDKAERIRSLTSQPR